MAPAIGFEIVRDPDNYRREHTRFLLALEIDIGLLASMEITGIRGCHTQVIQEYNDVVIRCSKCLETSHTARECAIPELSWPTTTSQPLSHQSHNTPLDNGLNKKASLKDKGEALAAPAEGLAANATMLDVTMSKACKSLVSSAAKKDNFTLVLYKKSKKPKKGGITVTDFSLSQVKSCNNPACQLLRLALFFVVSSC